MYRTTSQIVWLLLLLCTFSVAQNPVILGTVYDSKNVPLPGATILCENKSIGFHRVTTSAADGTFVIAEIPPGDGYAVFLSVEGKYFDVRRGISVNVGDERSVLPPLHISSDSKPLGSLPGDITIPNKTKCQIEQSSNSLTGTTRDPQDQPLLDVQVEIITDDRFFPKYASVDDSGHYKFDCVPTNKDLTISIYRGGRLLGMKKGVVLEADKQKAIDVYQQTVLANSPQRKYALLFATDEYDTWPKLQNPIYDAKTIEHELKENYGFETELVENATTDVIKKKLRSYAVKTYGNDDELFIFFAGHGAYDEVYKEGFVVGKNSKLHEDEVKDSYIGHSFLGRIIDGIGAKHVFVVLDVCFGGTFDNAINQKEQRGFDEYSEVDRDKFIERKMAVKSRIYLTSGGKEYVADGRPGEHSPFARKFIEALRTYGGKEKVLTIGKIFSFVEKLQPEPRGGGFGKNDPGGDFLFISK